MLLLCSMHSCERSQLPSFEGDNESRKVRRAEFLIKKEQSIRKESSLGDAMSKRAEATSRLQEVRHRNHTQVGMWTQGLCRKYFGIKNKCALTSYTEASEASHIDKKHISKAQLLLQS